MLFLYLAGFIVSSWLLIWSTRLVINSFEKLATKVRIGRMALAAILVALSTSLPELFIGVVSGFEGRPQISLGNVLGANIVNLSLVIGLATLLSGSVAIVGNYLKWEFVVAFLIGISPLILLLDGGLSRLDGIILIVIYLIYARDLVLSSKHKTLVKEGVMHSTILTRLKKVHKNHVDKIMVSFIFGIVLLFVSADVLVRLASALATALGLPALLIGLILVSLGTTLPELVLSIGAIKERKIALALGNILGSTVTNSTLIVGVGAIISPYQVRAFQTYGLASVTFVLLFGLFWLFTRTKKKLERWEALVLIGIYLMFVGIELLIS